MTTALYSRLGDRVNSGKKDPRLVWQKQARPDQLLPAGRWRVWYIQGGRGSGKTRSGAGALAEWVLGDTDGEGEYGIIGPTYADAWTKCVEGESGILRALGTSMAEIKDHRSATVRSAWRTYGQVVMHNGIVIYIDSAAEGGLRIQGRNLKGAWCDEIGLWFKWELAW
ncbi:MAG TPA: terminase family protein, partial [Streptosporangiaceae bacterium]